jgi:CPA2 family monovalent cation:H+ antiporter-2
MDTLLFNDLLVIFLLSITILFICSRARIPNIIGFLIAGIVAGPGGLGLVKGVTTVQSIAEIGVVLLLFTIGLEFSFSRLKESRRAMLLAGGLQVFSTIAVVWALAAAIGYSSNEALFIGMLVSLSSTAIVLKLLSERNQLESPYGRTVFAILIFQDLMIVPMMLITPWLGRITSSGSTLSPFLLIGGALALAVLTYAAKRWIVPVLLYQACRQKGQEFFIFAILAICFLTALFTSSIGLSFALGAFLAGMIIADSPYAMHAINSISPFRDVLSSFFFISIGMLLDVAFFITEPFLIIGIAALLIIVKALCATFATASLSYPARISVAGGLSLAQVGEFSFVLALFGLQNGAIGQTNYQIFLDATILTMVATPFLIQFSEKLATRLGDRVDRFMPCNENLAGQLMPSLTDHIIIIGFGLNGRNIARAAKFAGIPHIILEVNPDTVIEEQDAGECIYFADATQHSALEMAGIETARVIVIVISDPLATLRIIRMAREKNPSIVIIARTRFVSEVNHLREMGADEVIPEEFETSIEIFSRILSRYLVPLDEIRKLALEVRSESYKMFRDLSVPFPGLPDLKAHMPSFEVSTIRLAPESPVTGKKLIESRWREEYHTTILAIIRNDTVTMTPPGSYSLETNDLVVIGGSFEDVRATVEAVCGNPAED